MGVFKITQLITDRSDQSVSLYLKDINKYQVITPQEEIELAKRVQKGDRQAEEELIRANLKFVVSVAKSYQGKGLSLIDLIQEGNYGIIMAAHKYDYTKGYKFISYAIWWIRQSILKAISEQCRVVKIPTHQINNFNKIKKVLKKYGDKPISEEELSRITSMSVQKINSAFETVHRSVSMDVVVPGGLNMSETIPDNSQEPTDARTTKNEVSDKINEVLSHFSQREQDIIKMSFGISMRQLTLEEIAKRFSISSERVRQIQEVVLEKIRKRFKRKLTNLL